MGVCGPSEEERTQAAAAELAESKIEIKIETDDSQQGSTATAYGLETVGELLKRLAPQLKLSERSWVELSLEFSDVTVPHDRVLQEAAIGKGATVRVLGVKKIRLTRTDADTRTAVKAWCDDPVRAEAVYGHISDWETEQVTSMESLFEGMSEFNEDISRWDVGNVRNMERMFFNASSFNQDLSGWNVGNVQNMQHVFSYAERFNQDLSGWDVKNVTTMQAVFTGARSFNQNLSGWDVGNVEDMSRMFQDAASFNQDLNGWDVRNPLDTTGMLWNTWSLEKSNRPSWYSDPRYDP